MRIIKKAVSVGVTLMVICGLSAAAPPSQPTIPATKHVQENSNGSEPAAHPTKRAKHRRKTATTFPEWLIVTVDGRQVTAQEYDAIRASLDAEVLNQYRGTDTICFKRSVLFTTRDKLQEFFGTMPAHNRQVDLDSVELANQGYSLMDLDKYGRTAVTRELCKRYYSGEMPEYLRPRTT